MKLPRHVIIETTLSCNLKCKGCYRERQDTSAGHMPYELFADIMLQVFELGKTHIQPYSHGEPTLYPHFLRACDLIDFYGMPFSFATNGTDETGLINGVLPMRNCESVCFSLDGFNQDTRELFRPGAIMAANNACMAMLAGKNVAVSLLNQGQPLDEIQKFVDWWLEAGAQMVIIRNLLQEAPLPGPLPGWKRCRYHKGFYLTIKADGKVKLCERNVGSPVIGDVTKESIADILAKDTIEMAGDYCKTCAQRYVGETQYGKVERDGNKYFVRMDYYNTIYSLKDLRWGAEWDSLVDRGVVAKDESVQ